MIIMVGVFMFFSPCVPNKECAIYTHHTNLGEEMSKIKEYYFNRLQEIKIKYLKPIKKKEKK